MADIDQAMAAGAVPPEQEQVQQPEQRGTPQGDAPPTSITKGEEPTPEEQERFTRYELAVKTIIHDDPDRFDKVVAMLKAGKDDPIPTLAKTALMIFSILDEDVKGGVEEEYIMAVAEVCLDYIIDTAEKTGVMQVDEAMAEQAMVELVKQAGVMYDFDTTGIDEAVVHGKENYAAQEQAAAQGGQQQPVPAQPVQQPPVQQGVAPAGVV